MGTPQTPSLNAARWTIARTCPASWPVDLERCGGGYFHSPAGLLAGAPPGAPLFLQLRNPEEVVGIAVAVEDRGRWGLTPTRVYLPSVPALTSRVECEPAIASLVATLGARGPAVVMDSFGAPWCPVVRPPAAARARRIEFVVALAGTAADLASRCSTHHRRHLRRGERDGWALRLLPRPEGGRVLRVVQHAAAARGISRGEPFTPASHHIASQTVDDVRRPWGLVIFSACAADVVLAAAVVGYANGRAYYVTGGSTPEGYDCDASIWLHWRISAALAEAGFAAYNLGGVLAPAADAAHPMHGLHRFKTGFGSQSIECGGMQCPGQRTSLLGRLFRLGRTA